MTNVVLSKSEEMAIDNIVNGLTGRVHAMVQAELEQLDWTEDLDSEDWSQLQSDIVKSIR